MSVPPTPPTIDAKHDPVQRGLRIGSRLQIVMGIWLLLMSVIPGVIGTYPFRMARPLEWDFTSMYFGHAGIMLIFGAIYHFSISSVKWDRQSAARLATILMPVIQALASLYIYNVFLRIDRWHLSTWFGGHVAPVFLFVVMVPLVIYVMFAILAFVVLSPRMATAVFTDRPGG